MKHELQNACRDAVRCAILNTSALLDLNLSLLLNLNTSLLLGVRERIDDELLAALWLGTRVSPCALMSPDGTRHDGETAAVVLADDRGVFEAETFEGMRELGEVPSKCLLPTGGTSSVCEGILYAVDLISPV